MYTYLQSLLELHAVLTNPKRYVRKSGRDQGSVWLLSLLFVCPAAAGAQKGKLVPDSSVSVLSSLLTLPGILNCSNSYLCLLLPARLDALLN